MGSGWGLAAYFAPLNSSQVEVFSGEKERSEMKHGMMILTVLGVALQTGFQARGAPGNGTNDPALPSTAHRGGILLARTPAAPVDASGTAQFENGTPPVLVLRIRRLTSGLYQVSAINKTNGLPVFLGTIAIGNPTTQPDRDTYENFKQDSSTHQSSILDSVSRLGLPQGLLPTNIAQILLTDITGTVALKTAPPGKG